MWLDVEQINDVVEFLLGTTNDISEGIEHIGLEYSSIASESFAEIDLQIFHCESCSWWSEIHEMSELPDKAWTCRQCAGDGE